MEHTSKQILLNKISKAFDLLCGSLLDTFDSFKIIYVLLAYKRFNDLFEEGKVSKNSLIKIPEGCSWSQIETSSKQIFKQIDINLKKISSVNNCLEGIAEVFDIDKYQSKIPLPIQDELLNVFNSIDLSLNSFSFKEFVEIGSKLFHQHSILGHRGMEYVTPISLSKLMVKLLDPQITDKIYDPFAGLGDTLITAVTHIYENYGWPNGYEQPTLSNKIYLYDENEEILTLAKLRLAIAGVLDNLTITRRGSILDLKIKDKADVVFLRPPFNRSIEIEETQKKIPEELFSITFSYFSLSDTGRMSVVLPQSFLFRRDIRSVRETLFKEDCIEAIIQLPVGLWPHTSLSTILLVLNKNKLKERKHKVIFIKVDPVTKDGSISISDKEIGRIVATFKNFKVITENEEIVTLEEIQQNNYDLSTSQYIGAFSGEVKKLKENKTGSPLGDICEIIRGRSRKPHEDKDGLPFVTTKDLAVDVTRPFIDFNNVFLGQPTSERYIFRQKCILMSLVGNNLKPTIFDPKLSDTVEADEYDKKYSEILLGHNIAAIVPNEEIIDFEYLFYQLYSPIVKKQHESSLRSIGIPNISIQSLKTVVIPILKSLEDQRAFLKQYKESLLEAENAKYEALKERLKVFDKKQEAEFDIVRHLAHNIKPKIHMIKSPIVHVKNYLEEKQLLGEVLSTRLNGTKETLGDALNIAVKSSEQIHSILESARDLVTREIRKEDFQDVDIYKLFESDIKPLFANKPYKLIAKKVDSELDGSIQLHKESFIEAINNIIRNAELHAFNESLSDARLEFDINGNDENIIIDYKNNGLPFPRNMNEKDFLSFGTKSSDSPGEGLGGAWIGKVIEAHNGSFQIIRDENPVHFRITLPRKVKK